MNTPTAENEKATPEEKINMMSLEIKRQNRMNKIVFLVFGVFLLVFATVIFWAVNGMGQKGKPDQKLKTEEVQKPQIQTVSQTTPPASNNQNFSSSQEEIEKMRAAEKAAYEEKEKALKADFEKKIAEKQQVQVQPVPVAQVVQEPSSLVSVKTVSDYGRGEYGFTVRRLGRPVQKDGHVWIPLFRDKNPGSNVTSMEPVGKDVKIVQQQMSFDGVKPPPGELAVFDVVRDTRTGQALNVLAWRVKN